MKSLLRCSYRALVPLGLLLLAAPAGAQDIATAEALFDRGVADMKAGRYDTGCKAIAESQRLDPRPGTLFSLATCEAEWGRTATAVSRFGDYLALYDRLPDDKKAAQAERPKVAAEQRARLAVDVPQLTISLPKDAPAGTIVKRNGELLTDASLGIALPVDPGEYRISTQVPNGPPGEQRVTVKNGEKRQITLEVKAAPEVKVASEVKVAPKVAPAPSGRRVATYVVGAAGVAGLVAGGVLGGLAVGQKGIIAKHCGAGIGSKDDTACDKTGLDAAGSVKGFGLGSTIALAAGGAALGVAVVLFVTEPKPARPPTGMRGGWVSAGVLSAGPAGARLGVQGAF